MSSRQHKGEAIQSRLDIKLEGKKATSQSFLFSSSRAGQKSRTETYSKVQCRPTDARLPLSKKLAALKPLLAVFFQNLEKLFSRINDYSGEVRIFGEDGGMRGILMQIAAKEG